MTPIRKTSLRRNSFVTKHIRDTETSQCLSPQCTKKTECCIDIEPIPLRTRKTSTSTVQMYLRIKPMVKEENVYNILTEITLLTKFPSFENNIRNSKSAKSSEVTSRRHVFTKIFGSETSQAEMFERSIKHRVAQLLDGKSSTIMTYGTRDSGKTYTLFGTSASPGIIPRGIELVFSAINCTLTPWYKPTCQNTVVCLDETAQTEETQWKVRVLRSMDVNQISAEARRSLNNLQPGNADPEECHGESMYAVWVSFAEIYNGNIYDLLDDTEEHSPLRLTADSEGRSYVCSLRRVHVITALEACQIVLAGQSRMSTAATPSNPKSSRSHTIFTMTLLRYQKNRAADEVVLSTLTFCDLAGSTQFETHQERSQTREASNINNSLLVLGRCLKAVSQNRVAPFRDSKLTRIFQRALSGQESLSFIINVAFTPHFLNGEVQNTFAFCAIVRKLLTDAQKRCKRSCEVDNHVLDADSDVIASPSVYQTQCLSETVDMFSRVDSVAYKNLQEENTRLMNELKATKSDILNREYAIRQELADHYSRVIQELEATYKNHTKQIENEERDLLKWSVKQIENFYEERIDNLIRRKKRKREDGDDYIEDNRTLHAELETENTQVTSVVAVLKDAMKKLRKENKALLCEKNKCCFELALVTDELKKFRQLTQAGIRKWGGNSGNIDDDAECLVNNLERLMNEKVKRTEKTLEEMNKYIGAIKNKDAEDAAAKRELSKSQNLLNNALMKIRELEKELTRKEACIASLKHQAEIQEKQFTKVQERDLQNESAADKLDEWLNVSTLFPSQNQPVVESTKNTFLNISDIDRKSLFESSVDCSVSRSSDRSSKDDSGVSSGLRDRRSTSVSDSTNIRENEDKCTQTCFVEKDSRITAGESNVVRLETDCANSKRQNHKEISHIDELSQNLETIRDVISALNEAACVNERNIIRHECELLHKEDVLKLPEEKKTIATSKPNDLPEAKDKMEMCERELSELTSKLRSKEENKNRTFKHLESYVERFNFFENKISLMRDQLDKASSKCLNEHLPRIESLEEKVLRKTLRINELEEKIAQMQDRFTKGYELFEKIRDFEITVSRWQRNRNNLYRQLCECTEDQLNLEEKLKKLTVKLAERGSEVISLKSQVRGITDLNTTNSIKVRNLSEQVARAVESISLVKNDLQCCKDLRKNIENVMKMEIDDLRSWLSDYENNTKFLNKICKIYDNSRDEITSLRMQLQHKELEIALLTSNRVAIQKYDILTNDLRKEIEEKIKQNKTVTNYSNSSEEFLTKNNAICEIIDSSGKITSIENEKQSQEPLKVCSLTSNMCSTPKDARSKVLNVSSASSENSTTSFDDKDDADSKIVNNDLCQDRNVTSTVPFVYETNNLEVELYFDLKSSNNNKKRFDWIEIRKIEGTKPILSQLFGNSNVNSDPESE